MKGTGREQVRTFKRISGTLGATRGTGSAPAVKPLLYLVYAVAVIGIVFVVLVFCFDWLVQL